MGFKDPSALNLLVALPVLLLLYAGPWRRGKRTGLGRADFLFSLATLLVLCAALAGPYTEQINESSKALALIDISESMDDGLAEKLLAQAKTFQSSGLELSFLPFAGETSPAPLAGGMGAYRRVKEAWSKLNIGQTNLEQALRGAANEGASSVILISDGHENAGSAKNAVPLLTAMGVKVFPLVPTEGSANRPLFRISNLHAPLTAAAQKSAEIRVSVQNTTGRLQRGRVEVKHENKAVLETEIELQPNEEVLLTAQSDPAQEGIKEITARLTPGDRSLPASSETVFLSAEAREKVLLLSGTDDDRRILDVIFKSQSYQLSSIVAGERLTAVPDFGSFSAVIFNNVSNAQLPAGTLPALEKFVNGGGGFIMLGGNRSFGLGGYLNTPVAEILPVEMVPPQKEQKRLNVAVMLVIDKSRSMADNEKLEYSKEAAREVVRLLKDEDFVGVIGFDESPFEVVRMGQVGQIRAFAIERIGRLFPDKRTNLFPSMEEGRRRLEGVTAGRKHMIVLTDGKIPDANLSYVELVKQMRYAGITVSTVMIGSEFDFGFLRGLAQYGGGGYYQTDNPSNLPRIFLQDVKVQSDEKTMKEQQEFPVRLAGREPLSTSITSFPALRGFVENKPKTRANLELVVSAEDKAYPLLASWNYGRGRAGAFTSDANGRWSARWAEWPKFVVFWSEVLDSLRPRQGGQENLKFDLRSYLEHGALTLDLSVFNEAGTGAVKADLILPGQGSKELVFQPVSRGRYQATLERPLAGKYEMRAQVGGRKLTPVAFHLSGELFGERKGEGFDMPFLENLASASGGRVNPATEDLQGQKIRQVERLDLAPYLLLLAAAIFCFNILRREVFWRFRRAGV